MGEAKRRENSKDNQTKGQSHRQFKPSAKSKMLVTHPFPNKNTGKRGKS